MAAGAATAGNSIPSDFSTVSAVSAIALVPAWPDSKARVFRPKGRLPQEAVRLSVVSLVPLRAVAALALVLAATPAFASGAPLATYRAVHDLILDPAKDSPDVATVNARLVTEFAGSACAGYTTTTRFVTEAVDGDGNKKINDSRTVTFESSDGRLDFDNQSYDDNKLDEASRGSAQRSASGVSVKLTRPERKTVALAADLVFPTEQVSRVLDAARAGKHFVSFTGYDGLDDGESPSPTTIVIGAVSTDPSDVGDETPIAEAGFAAMEHWPVTISYFDAGSSVDQSPNYTMSAIIYDNGIMRQLRLDYGTFALIGKLTQLDVLPEKPCP